jgi:hypothetical protein
MGRSRRIPTLGMASSFAECEATADQPTPIRSPGSGYDITTRQYAGRPGVGSTGTR